MHGPNITIVAVDVAHGIRVTVFVTTVMLGVLGNGSIEMMLIPLCCPCRRLCQAALSGMSCDYVTAGDVDKAFPPGQGIPDSFQRCPLSYMLL